MTREIKFRVWDKEQREFLNNYSASLVLGVVLAYSHDGCDTDNFATGFDFSKCNKECNNRYSHYILQQFTGLKDKNGKEIYEGDILKMSGDLVGMVKFAQGEGSDYDGEWKLEYAKWVLVKYEAQNYANSYHLSAQPYREIIGNIFENPELLK